MIGRRIVFSATIFFVSIRFLVGLVVLRRNVFLLLKKAARSSWAVDGRQESPMTGKAAIKVCLTRLSVVMVETSRWSELALLAFDMLLPEINYGANGVRLENRASHKCPMDDFRGSLSLAWYYTGIS